ncbi:MAG: hypothetical protein EPO13_06005 [Actinomycetota bacterium]|nr:MAG: hypothetical protein EPO13_06005 [Actinomycetota bacterium]
MNLEFSAGTLPVDRVALLLVGSFLVTFVIVRLWVRMQRDGPSWWPRSLSSGGTHVHHLVPGIFLLLLSGFLVFALAPGSPWLELLAVAFGAGAALTLDEYALWLHLSDVYWSDEGRRSVDVIVVAFAVGGLVALGYRPLDLDTLQLGWLAGWWWVPLLVVVGNTATVVGSALKGKYYCAAIGIMIPTVALIGALRLAQPSSWWARRWYRDRPDKLARGGRRAAIWGDRRTRWWDAIGGRHGAPVDTAAGTASTATDAAAGTATGTASDTDRP